MSDQERRCGRCNRPAHDGRCPTYAEASEAVRDFAVRLVFRYAGHTSTCDLPTRGWANGGRCDCGWEAAVERGVRAFEMGGVCAPHGKCGGRCPSALFHRVKLALLAASTSDPADA